MASKRRPPSDEPTYKPLVEPLPNPKFGELEQAARQHGWDQQVFHVVANGDPAQTGITHSLGGPKTLEQNLVVCIRDGIRIDAEFRRIDAGARRWQWQGGLIMVRPDALSDAKWRSPHFSDFFAGHILRIATLRGVMQVLAQDQATLLAEFAKRCPA